jgi:TPR repeat protein
MYDFGKGVTQDDREAVNWYRLAAEQVHAEASTRLEDMQVANPN